MPDRRKYLFDIKRSIEALDIHLEGIDSFSKYSSSITVQRAVERELEIIGEAMNRLTAVQPDIPISETKKIIATRNRIIHGYDTVDNSIVWNVLKNNGSFRFLGIYIQFNEIC